MPREYTLLKNQPSPLDSCPTCGDAPFVPEYRGMIQSTWRRWLGLPYCCLICTTCDDMVGYEKPPARPD